MAMKREKELTIGDRSHVSVRSTVSYSVNWKTSPPLMSISCSPFASLKKFVSDLHEFGPFDEVRVGHYGEDGIMRQMIIVSIRAKQTNTQMESKC